MGTGKYSAATPEMLKYAERLEKLIEEKRLPQTEIASGAGVDKGTLSRHKNAETEAKLSDIVRLAKYFGVSTDYLLGQAEFKAPKQNIQDACITTGLSEDAVKILSDLENEIKEIVNTLLTAPDLRELLFEIYGTASKKRTSDILKAVAIKPEQAEQYQDYLEEEVLPKYEMSRWYLSRHIEAMVDATVDALSKDKKLFDSADYWAKFYHDDFIDRYNSMLEYNIRKDTLGRDENG